MQVLAKDIFSDETYEAIPFKDECVRELLTQEVTTKDESTEVELEGRHITEPQVLFGIKLTSVKC